MAASLHDLRNATGSRRAPPARVVLVAEDDDDTRFMLRTILEIRGYRVVEAADGEEAVRLAGSARPDLILMDGGLPRVDGFDATRRIRRFADAGRLPVVFVSGHAGPDFLAEARAAGCDEYIVKPFDLAQLGGVLEKYLGNGARAFTI